jgi:hypothetical protein
MRVDKHPSHHAERFTYKAEVLRELVEFDQPAAQVIDLVLDGITLYHD